MITKEINTAIAGLILDIINVSGPASACNAADLHGRFCGKFDSVVKSCLSARLSEDAALEILYPLAALADEVVMGIPQCRRYWSERPMQLRYFDIAAAGIDFFARLEALIGAGEEKNYLLELYFVCLALGFKGIYGVGDERRLRGFFENFGVMLMDARLKREGERGASAGKGGGAGRRVRIPGLAVCLGAASVVLMAAAAAAYLFALVNFTMFLNRF